MVARRFGLAATALAGAMLLAGCVNDVRGPSSAPANAGADYRRNFKGQDAGEQREFCRQNPGDEECFGRRF